MISQRMSSNFYVAPALRDAAFVFIRDETVRPSLKRPYDGPYKVEERSDKYFVLQRRGKLEKISIDRLKPAFVADEDLVSAPVLVTRSYPIIPAVRPPTWALPIAHSSAEAGHGATARSPAVAASAATARRAEGAQPVRRSSITPPPRPSPIQPVAPTEARAKGRPRTQTTARSTAQRRVTFDLPMQTRAGRNVKRPARYN